MLTLTVAARVNENGIVTLQLPPQVSSGYHKMVLVIEETEFPEKMNSIHRNALILRPYDVGPLPENFSLRREDLYDDWGR